MSTLPYKIAVLCDLRDEAGRLLLIHRAKEPNKGLVSPIGGKLETATGESPAQCAQREIQEEAGIIVPIERLRLAGMISEQGYLGQAHWLMFIYRAIGPVQVNEATIREGDLRWHEFDELQSLPMPETDRKVIWPLIRDHEDGFFAAHIDCTGPQICWTLEESFRHHGKDVG